MATLLWVNGANFRFSLPCNAVTHTVEVLPPTPPPNPVLRPYEGVLYNWELIAMGGQGLTVYDSGSGYSPSWYFGEPNIVYIRYISSSPNNPFETKRVNFFLSFVEEFRLDPYTPEPGAPDDPNRRESTIYRLKVFLSGVLHRQADYSRLPNVQKQCEGDCPPGCRKVLLSKNTGDYCCCPVKCC